MWEKLFVKKKSVSFPQCVKADSSTHLVATWRPGVFRPTWSHWTCTTLPSWGCDSKLCSDLPWWCPSGSTRRTGCTLHLLRTDAQTRTNVSKQAACSIAFCSVSDLTWLHNTLRYFFRTVSTRLLTVESIIITMIQNRTIEVVLTAVFRSKLPQVQVLHGEVDKGGQLAGSPGFRETLQVLDRQESQGATTPHINARWWRLLAPTLLFIFWIQTVRGSKSLSLHFLGF